MDGTCEIKQDILLRQFLSDPENFERPVRRSVGSATIRAVIAGIDALQTIMVGLLLAPWMLPMGEWPVSLWQAGALSVVAAVLALMIRRGARPTTSFCRVTARMVARRAGWSILLACATLIAITALVGGLQNAQALAPWIASWAVASALVSYGFRAVPIPLARKLMQRAIRPTVAVVGVPSSAQMMADMLSGQGTHLVIAQLNPHTPSQIRRLEQLAVRGKVDKVVIVGCNEAEVERVCFGLSDTPTLVCIGFASPTTSTLMAGGLHATQHPPFLPLLPSPMSDWRGILKRSLDVGIVIGLTPFIAPVLLGAALAIRLESRGPVFFKQWRFGLGSKPTQILKFRSMYHDRGDKTGEARTLARDPRVTRVGRILRRTSIDELPQLLNVLRGEMSLVGPRPHATHMKVGNDYYFEAVQGYRIRHRVKPGITGWAQVTGSRGEVDTMEKALERVEKDLWYVRNWSLALDIRILAMTALGRFATPAD